VSAHLKNFSVWVPLNAESDQSKVFALSFVSDFKFKRDAEQCNYYDKNTNYFIRNELLIAKDNLSFSIKNLEIYLEKFGDAAHQFQGRKILNPCQLSLGMESTNKAAANQVKNTIHFLVEPITVRIGFQEIDFANSLLLKAQDKIQKKLNLKIGAKLSEEEEEKEELGTIQP